MASIHSGYQESTVLGSSFFGVGFLLRQATLQAMADTGLHPTSLSSPATGMGMLLFSISSKGPGLAAIDQIGMVCLP